MNERKAIGPMATPPLRAGARHAGRVVATLVGCSLLGFATASPANGLSVMTQNQYLGTDLTPIVGAATAVPFDEDNFNNAVVTALREIAATRPAARTRRLAAEIALRQPHVVGLQEAFEFTCTPYPGVPAMPGMGCDDPSIKPAFTDHLRDTVAALRGWYTVAGKVTNLKVAGIPFKVNGYPAVVSVADRDAILVRRDVSGSWVDFAAIGACPKPSDQGCNYVTAPDPFDTPIGVLAVERGFLAVDVTVQSRTYRVINTHLEQRLFAPDMLQTRLLQVGQAYELGNTALAGWDGRPLIVLGDFNSDPRDTIPVPPYPPTLPGTSLPTLPPYAILAQLFGFTDTWTLQPFPRPGFTCCQDADLKNRTSKLDERIDLIFALPRPAWVLFPDVMGDSLLSKVWAPGVGWLWPSDHGAVAATLVY